MRWRVSLAALMIAACMSAAILCLHPGRALASAPSGQCPNEALRVGASAALPECRAYEVVSPPNAEPNFIFTGAPLTGYGLEDDGELKGTVQVAEDDGGMADGLALVSSYPVAGASSSGEYLRARRGAGGWSSEAMIPPQSPSYSILCRNGYIAAYSPDLTKAVLGDGVGQPGSTVQGGNLRCGTDDPTLVPSEPKLVQNLFLGEGAAGPFQLIDATNAAPEGAAPADAWFLAASEDLSHVVFMESAQLTPEAPLGSDVYEWSGGTVRLVTRLPDGTPAQGTLANSYEPEDFSSCCVGAETITHSVSKDGTRIDFTANGDLYLRVNADQPQSPLNGQGECDEPTDACTFELDEVEGGSQAGGGVFGWATPDGSKVFFTDDRHLTANSTAEPGKPDLYEYDLSRPPGARLTDLTTDIAEPADVLGLSGISTSGDYVYFAAEGALTPSTNSVGDSAQVGQPNLYLLHDGAISFVATLDDTPPDTFVGATRDSPDWEADKLTSRVSADGGFIAFNSVDSLTGYDNTDVNTGEPDDEIYLYEAATQKLRCVSCDPEGAQPTASAKIRVPSYDRFGGGAPFIEAGHLQQYLTEDGGVFFDTAEALPGSENGLSNVYEYVDGELHLISTGTSEFPSYFYEATPSGNDAFIMTAQELPSGAAGTEFKVYDARVGGGFPPATSTTGCGESDCRGATSPGEPLPQPGTLAALSGGNFSPAPPVTKVKSSAQIRREDLARALKKCHAKRSKKKRLACEAIARRRYGAKSQAAHTKTTSRRGK
jgi:hypothetical protein